MLSVRMQDSWTDQLYLSLQYSWNLPCIAKAGPRAGLSTRVLEPTMIMYPVLERDSALSYKISR